MKDAVGQWTVQIGRKSRSKQSTGTAAEQRFALRSDLK